MLERGKICNLQGRQAERIAMPRVGLQWSGHYGHRLVFYRVRGKFLQRLTLSLLRHE